MSRSMAALVALASAAPLIFTAAPALAQSPAPSPAQSPAANARGKVVVVADLLSDETANAKLRAAVYETARGRGFEPDPKADVTTAATSSGAMQAGSVSTEEAPLHSLRKAVGATLLVRVAPGDAGKARVVVISETAAKSAMVDANENAITTAVGSLLDELGAKAAPPPAAAAGPEPLPPGSAGVITSGGPSRRGVQTEDEEAIGPEAIKQRWEARGGLRASWEVRAMATGLVHPNVPYSDTNPQTTNVETGEATTYGIGGGVGFRISMIYLPLAQPHKGSSTWGAFRLGVGGDANVLYVRPPIGYTYKPGSRDTQYDDKAFFYGVMPVQLGFLVGFGSYRSDTIWRGTALGIAYAPAVIYALEIGKTVGDFEFNYGGIEASIDIVSIEADREASADPHIRLFAYLLPRVRDELPWLLSAGIGVAWY